MKVNFLTTSNYYNGYGMIREHLKKYLPKYDIMLESADAGNDVTFVLHIPPAMQRAKGGIKILYTMLEGDTVPDSWYQYLREATHILVPSSFVKETFHRAGFDATVIPLGYDAEIFQPIKREKREVYTFLHYEAFQNRKGWEDLLDAWLISGLAQKTSEVKLILKTIKPLDEVYKKKQDYGFFSDNVEIIVGKLPHKCMAALLGKADCFVFPSRGEGFSLPPIEAMATGLPVIISKGHSHLDYYDERYMYGVDANIKIPARYDNWEDQGNFVRCNVDDLAEKLNYVYHNKCEATRKGKKAVSYVKKYAFETVAKNLKAFLWQIKG